MTLWKRRPLVIPPNSLSAWMQLAAWEMWMGMLLFMALALGLTLVVTSPTHIVALVDLSPCYAPPPVVLPCERIVYRTGQLYMFFTALCGFMLLVAATWFLWELWRAVEPKPITDDFLKLLNDSFGRDWRNPFTWPWARVLWAYGFTSVGATATAGAALILWALVAESPKPPTVKVETSHTVSVQP